MIVQKKPSIFISFVLISFLVSNFSSMGQMMGKGHRFGKGQLTLKYINTQTDMDRIDWQGRHMIHYAVLMGNIDMVKELVKRGADINASTAHCETPLGLALTNKYNDNSQNELFKGANRPKQKELPAIGNPEIVIDPEKFQIAIYLSEIGAKFLPLLKVNTDTGGGIITVYRPRKAMGGTTNFILTQCCDDSFITLENNEYYNIPVTEGEVYFWYYDSMKNSHSFYYQNLSVFIKNEAKQLKSESKITGEVYNKPVLFMPMFVTGISHFMFNVKKNEHYYVKISKGNDFYSPEYVDSVTAKKEIRKLRPGEAWDIPTENYSKRFIERLSIRADMSNENQAEQWPTLLKMIEYAKQGNDEAFLQLYTRRFRELARKQLEMDKDRFLYDFLAPDDELEVIKYFFFEKELPLFFKKEDGVWKYDML